MATTLNMAELAHEDDLPRSRLVALVLTLSVPGILSELSTTLMQYIDAGMVGNLGAAATAAIGLVESCIWLLEGWLSCVAAGFSVQVAQLIGAGKTREARNVVRQSIVVVALIATALSVFGAWASGFVPTWLSAAEEVRGDASRYLFICACAMVPMGLARLATGLLQCAGDMRTPSIANIGACVLDVCLNALFIPRSRTVFVFGRTIMVPGLGLGVTGAALATLAAQLVTATVLLALVCLRSETLNVRGPGRWLPARTTFTRATTVSGPMLLERTVMSCAYIAGTAIVAPLGTVAVAANSLAVTAEAVCYMPGMGVSVAATTLVGQAMGAKRPDLAKRFARTACATGMALFAVTGIVMYGLSPQIMGMLTSDTAVAALGVRVLRIEAFAEPLFCASIVCAGALRGAADTLVPSLIVLGCMWGVRLTAASLLSTPFGLVGVWVAMAAELCLRGILFLVRLLRGRWAEHASLA